MATCRCTPTIINKILEYKETVQSVIVDDEVSFSSSARTCNCERSTFRDENHGHIIRGDLGLITNTKLRRLLSKGHNYREQSAINYSKSKIAFDSCIDNCIEKLKTKYKFRDNDLNVWKDFVKQEVKKTKSEISEKTVTSIRHLKFKQ